jgi:hypothetical protein
VNAVAPSEFIRLLVLPAEVEGNVNLFSEWQQGKVFLSQGRYASDITFNYDLLNHMIWVMIEGKEYSLNPVAVDSIFIANSSQVLVNPIILDGIDSDLLLLRVYDSQHLSLFRNTMAEVLEVEEKTTSTTELVYDYRDIQFDQEQIYLLLNKTNNEVRELKGRKKELKRWEHGDQVMAFVKNQNLDLKKEPDLIQVVQYYEQLTFRPQ